MITAFRRPVGAQADIKELEYIAALQQTCFPMCRENGTVSSLDILRFLKSRIGIEASHDHCLRVARGIGGGVIAQDVIEKIVGIQESHHENSAAGSTMAARSPDEAMQKMRLHQAAHALKSRLFRVKVQAELEVQKQEKDEYLEVSENADNVVDDDEPEEYLDLVQLTAALLIPTLARAAKEWRESRQPNDQAEEQENGSEQDKRKPGFFARMEARAACQDRELYESLRPQPDGLIQDATTVLLRSLPEENSEGDEEPTSTSGYPKVTTELVRALLEAHGEHERAADSKLIQQMVEAASSSSGLFDEEAFVNAVASDVSDYPVESDGRLTSGFNDVYGFESLREQKKSEEANGKVDKAAVIAPGSANVFTDKGGRSEEGTDDSNNFRRDIELTDEVDDGKYNLTISRTLSLIDFAVDAHTSVTLMVVIWVFFITTTILYATLFHKMEALQPSCDSDKFGCRLGSKVVTWMVFACIFAMSGYIMVLPLSAGNSPRWQSPSRALFSFCLSILYTWIPYTAVNKVQADAEEPFTDAEQTLNDRTFDRAQWVVRAIGILLACLYFVQLTVALLGDRLIQSSKILSRRFTPAAVRGAAKAKRAATRKINTMLLNAHCLHSSVSGVPSVSSRPSLHEISHSEETMVNFVLRGETTEPCGGLFWTWKMILSGALFDNEGVWIFSRLIVIQATQVVLAIFITLAACRLTERVADNADQANADLGDDLPGWVYDLVPTSWEVRVAFYPATCVAFAVMVALILVYLPSYVGTTLMYRCGLIPSLKSPYFVRYRTNVDLVYGNIGNAIYALLGSAILFWFLAALALFLLSWPFSQNFMLLLIAWGIGLAITIVLKMILLKIFRKRFYAAFYRTRPGAANLSTLGLECWFIGLGGGVLIGRFTQFILAACFWVGRTDVPFLSEDVNLMGYAFDYVPTNFVKDLLVHDAHHHPYLERLLTMYLMKLKNNNFCSDAGACWRQLFIVSWMPWLMKCRVFSDKRLVDAMEAHNKRRLEREEENRPKGLVEEIKAGLSDMEDQVIDQRPSMDD